MDLKTPLKALTGIGYSYAKKLERLGLYSVDDLLNHYPFRYDDFSSNQTLSQTKTGEKVTLKGEVWSIKNTYTRFGKVLTQAVFNDGTGTIELIWFNQPWLTKSIKTGDNLQVSGKINRKGNKLSIVFPVWEKINSSSNSTIHTGRLIPVYPETYGVTSKWLRAKIAKLLPFTIPKIIDPMPEEIILNKFSLKQALEQVHFPDNLEQAKLARERLSFDELFYIQLSSLKTKREWQEKELTKGFKVNDKKLSSFIKSLPFKLTSAQKKVVEEIIEDLKKTNPMNRLVQGDVGSGKTIVAAITAYLAHLNGLKTVIMAPTEILAFQHFETLSKFLEPYGVEVGIYTGSRKSITGLKGITSTTGETSSNSRDTRDTRTPCDTSNIIIGTHALLSKKLKLDNVGLVVIDEQQRFGVEQRSLLRSAARSPHFLTMTATPIPRTVALTLYGDLDLSIIDELPKGRKLVRTHYVPSKKRADAYKFIEKHIEQGFQTYIITPLIEESETLATAKAAKVEFERLKKDIFPNLKLGLLHGKLKSKEKEQVLNDFKNHRTDILVSTSVVEVGVDVPNATIMVIEGAERFGLAQLHQLRGRVGRGEAQSFTFLFTEIENPQIISRLKHLEKIHDGLKLSEIDLKIRGAGQVFGTLQSGQWNLKIASLSDLVLIEETKTAASKILQDNPNLDKYPLLASKLVSQGETIMPD